MAACDLIIGVLGAKPESKDPRADVVYLVNGATLQAASNESKYVCFFHSAILEHKGKASHSRKEKTSAIASAPCVNCVVMANSSQDERGVAPAVAWHLPCKSNVVTLKRKEVLTYMNEYANLEEPLWDSRVLYLPFSEQKEYLIKIFTRYTGKRKFPSPFRISTGVAALLYAIKQHGLDVEYIVNGIGFGSRTEYSWGRANKYRTRQLESHVMADELVLRRLAQVVQMKSNDKSFSEKTGCWYVGDT